MLPYPKAACSLIILQSCLVELIKYVMCYKPHTRGRCTFGWRKCLKRLAHWTAPCFQETHRNVESLRILLSSVGCVFCSRLLGQQVLAIMSLLLWLYCNWVWIAAAVVWYFTLPKTGCIGQLSWLCRSPSTPGFFSCEFCFVFFFGGGLDLCFRFDRSTKDWTQDLMYSTTELYPLPPPRFFEEQPNLQKVKNDQC